ncbi:MAG: aldo/keto reductase [Tindallia sp. MSAO_Bac2]|nr:MAG: aldo/keto reductase [Tindallia sp. MSAO_Bac2]
MIYRPYGKTGKHVSVIGMGGMRFGEDDDYGAEVVRYASSNGINYFDTAPFYNDDRSEDIFGKAFQKMPAPFYVSTKSSINSDETAADVRHRIETSLKRMNLEKINFYHMWCIMDLDQYQRIMVPGGPYEGALKAKEEGLIEHLCFSTHCKGEDIEAIIKDDVFEGVLLGYNVINHPFRQQGVDAARRHQIGVVTMNPLGGGLIPRHQDYFDFIREHWDETVPQAALRFNAAQEGITVALAGMGSLEEVDENIKVIDRPLQVSDAKVEEIRGKVTSFMDQLCTNCQYCRKCPLKIKMNYYMEAYNLYLLMGEEEMFQQLQWYRDKKDLKEKDLLPGDCTACGICESLCTQKLPIIDRLQEMNSMMANRRWWSE